MFFENIIFDMNDNKNSMNPKIFNAKEGFMHGNMFKNEYEPYKNYKVAELVSSTEKGNLLLKIYEYDFALNDLSLYLDIHPEDKNLYNLFKKYTEEQRACIDMYEKKYGPLEINDSPYDSYMWEKGPWPFEGGNV